jgi:4-carboxymuconolactone decarboxylase
MEDGLKKRTKETAALYFDGVTGETPFMLWKAFDPELAKQLSLFVTGKMYARERLPHTTRQLITVSALAVLGKTDELSLHIQAALNVGCRPEELAETIFQTMVYGGVPSGNAALKVLRDVLKDRDLWPIELLAD